MSNRRVKSLAVDDDHGFIDDDDYEEDEYYEQAGGNDEELSPEDREKLRLGTVKVRQALGTSIKVTDDEVQEALWHYYYDVGKSVTYLKNKHPPATTTPKKTKSEPRIMSFQDQTFQTSAKDFFWDCPWLQIPEQRRADILIQPIHSRRGLLGGASSAGKSSKLAALAAKRRQKEKENQAGSESGTPTPEDYAASLGKLNISQQPAKRQANSSTGEQSVSGTLQQDRSGSITSAEHKDTQITSKIPDRDVDWKETLVEAKPARAHPSPFASIMVTPSQSDRTLSIPHSVKDHDNQAFNFTEPSPDDIVFRAQNAKAPGTSTPKSKTSSKTSTPAEVANGVAKISIQDTPNVKSKNLDVVAEYKKAKRKNAANFVVIGHVDAGKSTLMGRLLYDLKAIDQRTIDKYKREAERIGKGSFAFAWVLDQGTEERERGVTIDIATNKFETAKTSFTILDAPGHRDFVPNMIAGASQADFAVLVIDASTGEFESGMKGQTKEHALLVRSIGVSRIIVAVNKMDAAGWSEDRFQEIQQQMSAFLSSAGFQSKNVSFIPCSGLEGANILRTIKDVDPKAQASWYHGPTLVEELDKAEPTNYAMDKPLRMTINDVFRGGVTNPLSVSGRIEAGTIQNGERVLVVPSNETAIIKALEVDMTNAETSPTTTQALQDTESPDQEWAVAGQNVTLHLSSIDSAHLKTGDVICSPTSPIRAITQFTAKILAFEHLTPMNVDVHRGRLHVPGKIVQLVATLDKSSGVVVKKKPKIVQPGNVVRVVVSLDTAVPLEPPGRVVLRNGGETVAAGLLE